MRNVFFVSLSVLALFVPLTWFTVGTTYSATQQVIRFSHGFPEKHFMSAQFDDWAKLIEEQSKGALKVEVYSMGQLYRDPELVRTVQMGGIESGQAYTYTVENTLNPTMKVFSLPFMFYSTKQLVRVAESEIVRNMRQAAEKKGVKLLAWLPWPAEGNGLILSKEAKTPSDIKGMVLRVGDPVQVATVKKWGAGGSYVPSAEVYMAIQRHTLQGAMVFLTTVYDRKLYEVAPYFTALPTNGMFCIIVMNKAFFDRLTPQLQQVIVGASQEVERKSPALALRSYEGVVDFAKKTGKIKIYSPTPSEMALWGADREILWKEALKGDPETQQLADKMKAVLAGEKN